MITTLYLRFPDEATFRATLDASFVQHGETGSPLPEGVDAIRIVGALYEGGTFDADGNVVTPPTQVPGFHVNVLTTNDGSGPLPAAWGAYQVFPATPQGVFG